ncbi:MAG: cytochrome b N-terminal domain-containing protein, partial [Chloroflexota bacterium]
MMPNLSKRKEEPEVLPGADAESDCQVPDVAVNREQFTVNSDVPSEMGEMSEEDDEYEHDVTWGDVGGVMGDGKTAVSPDSWRQPQAGWAGWLENIALAVEKPVNRLVGNLQLNPLYHTGTIAFFLLLVVGLTGIYLFMFFQYGFDLSYQAVDRLESQFIGRTMRALHRYASGALVITALLHAYRTLFMERFRGPRWLAWMTGIVMVIILWAAGVTGYWMLWDARAQVMTRGFTAFLERHTGLAADTVVALAQAALAENTWWVIGILMALHVLLFVITAVFFWLHIKRLSRPKWLPDVQWTVGLGLVLLLGAVLFPVGMLPQANEQLLPGVVTIDPIFLFYLPLSGTTAGVILWLVVLGITAVGLAFPWLSKGSKTRPAEPLKVHII